jgi:hypothetical protein
VGVGGGGGGGGAVLGVLSPRNGELGRPLERQHGAHRASVEIRVDPADFHDDLLLLSRVSVPQPLVARVRALAVRVVPAQSVTKIH